MVFDQAEFDIRCEWGNKGVARLTPISDVIIIVDVMSFSTCVDIAVNRGAVVYPYRYKDESAKDFAESIGAELAGRRGEARYSLSPVSLMDIPKGTKLVLPSPNGSTLSLSTGDTPTLTGCLRNCGAVARAAMMFGKKIGVIPAGERWKEDDSIRPAFEDLVGAGAIIDRLNGTRSPEAEAAVAAYQRAHNDMITFMKRCVSGKELIEMGFEKDIPVIAELDIDNCAPILHDGVYFRYS